MRRFELSNLDCSNVETLVIDEADTMCDKGFLPDIRKILNYLPAERQTLFFAATMPKAIRALAEYILTAPKTVQIGIIAPARNNVPCSIPHDRENQN